MKRFVSLVICFLFSLTCFCGYAETDAVKTYTLTEVLDLCGISTSEFSQITLVSTNGSSRSGQKAILLSSPSSSSNVRSSSGSTDERCAYVMVYDDEANLVSPERSSARGTGTDNYLFRLNSAGVAIAGYCYYERNSSQ